MGQNIEEKNIAALKDEGKNITVWCGDVISPLEFSHEIKNKETGKVLETFYRFDLKVEVKTNKGKVLDQSELPLVVGQKYLDTLEKVVEVGDTIFVRGSWRAYTVVSDSNKRRTEQVGFVQHIEHTEITEEKGKYLNRFDFEGYLVSKLFVPVRDENGKPKRHTNGTFVPLLDENGKKQYTTRLNKEKKIVNDFTLAINKKGDAFYIPSLAYFNVAKKVANEVPVGAKVKGSGYIRSRRVEEKDKLVYEAVIVSLDVLSEKVEDNIE